jgi:hypothetical protein
MLADLFVIVKIPNSWIYQDKMVRTYLERTWAALWRGTSATYHLIESLVTMMMMMMMQMEERTCILLH